MLGLRLDPSLENLQLLYKRIFKKATEHKKISIEASAIEFLKGSYQSVSPKTLKEGG